MHVFFLLRLTNGKPSTKVVDRRQICISVSKYLICRQNLTNAAFTCQALVSRETVFLFAIEMSESCSNWYTRQLFDQHGRKEIKT